MFRMKVLTVTHFFSVALLVLLQKLCRCIQLFKSMFMSFVKCLLSLKLCVDVNCNCLQIAFLLDVIHDVCVIEGLKVFK